MSPETLWWLTLAAGLAVALVVWLLLHRVVASARRIRSTVAEIWVVGPQIAANTAQIDLVRRIDRVAADVLAAAGLVAADVERIRRHAESCPGCPACLSGGGGAP